MEFNLEIVCFFFKEIQTFLSETISLRKIPQNSITDASASAYSKFSKLKLPQAF